jgi:hypothetical protein
VKYIVMFERCFLLSDGEYKLEMVQRRAARYVQNNYHNTSRVTSMIDTLGWPTLAERRLKTRLIMRFSTKWISSSSSSSLGIQYSFKTLKITYC